MKEVLDAFGEGWRRLVANPLIWLAPLLMVLVGLFVAFLGAIFACIPVVGFLVLYAVLIAYLGGCAAGMMGLLQAAVTRRATDRDFSQGVRRFFWRAVGLLLLAGLANFALTALVGSVTGGFVPSWALDGPQRVADAFRALTNPVTLALQFIAYFVVIVLFGFAAPAITFDDCRTVSGIERGLGLVRRKPGAALGLLALAVVLVSMVPSVIALLSVGRLFASWSTEQGLAASVSGSFAPIMLLLVLYGYIASLLVSMAIFVFYERNRSLLGAPSGEPQPGMPAAPEPPGGQVVGP